MNIQNVVDEVLAINKNYISDAEKEKLTKDVILNYLEWHFSMIPGILETEMKETVKQVMNITTWTKYQ